MTDQESSTSKPRALQQNGGSLPRNISPAVRDAYSSLRPAEQRRVPGLTRWCYAILTDDTEYGIILLHQGQEGLKRELL